MRARRIIVNDLMQSDYKYRLTHPVGRHFDTGFQPDLTPPQMLELGVFGGKYLTDCTVEFPAEWFVDAKLCAECHDPVLNYFGVTASTTLSYWREKNWIREQDPRGWFQWYCRYYFGRRSQDDTRQISRWRGMLRHVAQLRKHCEPWDMDCRRRQRQALLQWAYDARNY